MGVLEDLFSPSKADASPARFVTKQVSGPVSSAAKRLIGHEISGMTIKNVVKGKGDVRYITFEGTDYVMGVNKNTLHSLAREFGSEVYPETAEALGGARGLKMAIKSAERLLNLKNTGPYTKDELAAIEAKHINNLQELELSAAKKVWFKYRGEKIHLLEPYARILENYNLGKRVK